MLTENTAKTSIIIILHTKLQNRDQNWAVQSAQNQASSLPQSQAQNQVQNWAQCHAESLLTI